MLIITVAVMIMALLYACANVVAPTGGPKDETPPRVIRSNPPNYATHFNEKQIRIFFDEFIRLHNLRQQMLVSPPLKSLPEVRIRGRSIIIDIEEELRPNSTYNFFFGDAIRDITEGNAIPNFQFVFSTGSYVDSLSVRGQVRNAFNHKPEEGVFVMLYDQPYDSVPYLERPVYLAKTDKEGRFLISNMADGLYLMFALRDNNANFLFDLPDEKIAFLDSLIRPEYFTAVKEPDTNDLEEDLQPAEGLHFVPEAAEAEDKAPGLPESGVAGNFYELFLFQEADTVQRVVSASLTREGLITIAFRIPYDSAHVREIRRPFDKQWHIPEFSAKQDTLRIWFAETGRDSLFLEIRDCDRILDTIARSTTLRARRDRREADTIPAPLAIRATYRRATAVPFFEPVGFVSEHPLADIRSEKIRVLMHDSINVETGFHFADEVRRKVLMTPLPEEGSRYHVEFLPGAFEDIFGLKNDSLHFRFTASTRENYGNLIIHVELPEKDYQFLLQLLDRDQRVLGEKTLLDSGTYTFEYLGPGSYGLRLVHDKNNNGRWDTGHYLKGIQPETVTIFPETIQIRENWDVEINLQP
ncbi:MAG: Ig-like domain-containing protein [Bacteroidales bacterium]|nr:Ig-like domain-containing protein [Bacteroidales bacterium]